MSEAKSPAPVRASFKPITKVESIAELFRHPDLLDRLNRAIPKHLSGERMLRTMVTATQKVPKLAQASPMSMLGACMTIATLGLEPNTPLGLCHMIPFEVTKWNSVTRQREYIRTDVQVIIGYPGYLDLIYRSGMVADVHCDVVWEDEVKAGRFSYEHGSNKHLMHKPLGTHHPPGEEPVAAYMYAKLSGGGEEFVVLQLADIHRLRARSQGFNSAMHWRDVAILENKDPLKDKRYTEAPWIKDFEAMFKKTALRAGQKWLPKSIELATAMAIDGDGGKIDFSKITDSSMVVDATYEVMDDEDEGGGGQGPEPAPAKAADKAPVSPAGKSAGKSAAKSAEKPLAADIPQPAAASQLYPLFNAYGEEDEGMFGPTDDPMDFVERYITLREAATDPAALYEANESVIATLPAKYRALVMPEKAAPAEEKWDIPRKKKAGGTGWDMLAYLADAEALYGSIDNVADLKAAEQANEATAAKLGAIAIKSYGALIQARLDYLAPPLDDEIPGFDGPQDEEPPLYEPDPETTKAPAPDEWQALHDTLVENFSGAATKFDLQQIAKNGAIRAMLLKLLEGHPALAQQLADFYKQRLADL